jgi:Na+-transporting NADH:ubiquinone oxidoreductase subunit A
MHFYQIRKGRDIKLKGSAEKVVTSLPLPKKVAVVPTDFHGIKPRLAVKEGDLLKRGSPVLTDKNNPDFKVLSPVSGKVAAIVRGEKRVLLQVVIDVAAEQEALVLQMFAKDEARKLSRDEVIRTLLAGGMWPALRQRPFSFIANPNDHPKAVFVHAMNTEPLALDPDTILEGKEEDFQLGLDILKKLTAGKVHLCTKAGAKSKALTQAKNVEHHQFAGPHPAGNVSTHIHLVDPIKKGDVVWYVEAQHVLNIAQLFTQGAYPNERYVAVTGEGAEKRFYAKTVTGAPLAALLDGRLKADMRYISGSVLAGTNVGQQGYVGYYDSQITVIPEGGKRRLLGWIAPGFKSYSFSKTFVSSFVPEKESSLTTDKQGSDRAIVLNHIYDRYVPLDIMTFFLLRAVISGDIEEAERLGILECDEEDFALCTFACPSKTDVGGIIRGGLDEIAKEG